MGRVLSSAFGAIVGFVLCTPGCGGSEFSAAETGGTGGSAAGSSAGGSSSGAGGSAGGSGATGGSGGTSGGSAGSGNASSGGNAGSGGSVSCPEPTGDELWVDGRASDGGNGSEACPFRTIADGIAGLAGSSATTVLVQSGSKYAGGFTVPSGYTVRGSDVNTELEGTGMCDTDSACAVIVSANAHLENFTIVLADSEDGVLLRTDSTLRQVKTRGGRRGIVVNGQAVLELGVEATDSLQSGVEVVAGGNLGFPNGDYKFTGSQGVGLRVLGPAVIDMSHLTEAGAVDFSDSVEGIRFEGRSDAVTVNTPASEIRFARFQRNQISLTVRHNVKVNVRDSEFFGAAKPAVQLFAPNYANFGDNSNLGGNVFQREDPGDTVALMMLCDQPFSNTPKIALVGNTFPNCPSIGYSGRLQVGSCPDYASGADTVAFFPGATTPGEAAFNGSCN
ncbi:MAG: hypothetical protein R3B07_15565 [Polyangiaceae bacterium]